jgi:hypothetical protein
VGATAGCRAVASGRPEGRTTRQLVSAMGSSSKERRCRWVVSGSAVCVDVETAAHVEAVVRVTSFF